MSCCRHVVLIALLLDLLCTHSRGFDRQTDEVIRLPGWVGPMPSRMYSGLLELPRDGSLYHYILVEAQVMRPDTPLLLWLNGGPGASSLTGFLTENGPFTLNDASYSNRGDTAPLTLQENRWSWTKFASVLYLESPAGVGFSRCPNNQCGQWTDERVASDNYAAIGLFFRKFEEYRSRDFWLTGESYAGIYIPMLADKLLSDPKNKFANLKGVIVGNGCLGTASEGGACGPDDAYWNVMNLRGHQLVSAQATELLLSKCEGALRNNTYWHDPVCKGLLRAWTAEYGMSNPYNIYDECFLRSDEATLRLLASAEGGFSPFKIRLRKMLGNLDQVDYLCGNEKSLPQYLNTPEVKEALHVSGKWVEHDNGDGIDYKLTQKDVRPIYEKMLNAGKRVLVYYGDTDGAVVGMGGEYWTSRMGFKLKEKWRPWMVSGKGYIGGSVTRYDNGFDFLTIRGAGHMVPRFKPEAAFVFMYEYLYHDDWARFAFPPSTPPEHSKSSDTIAYFTDKKQKGATAGMFIDDEEPERNRPSRVGQMRH